MLAKAYLEDNNEFWAIKTLVARLETAPDDCEARTWLAWTHLKLANIDLARDALNHHSCRRAGPFATRAMILHALITDAEKNRDDARAELSSARNQARAFPKDRRALDAFSRLMDGERLPEVAWQAEVRRGYTTNALLGSPVDPSDAGTKTGSSFFQANAWARFSPDMRYVIRPSLELQTRVFSLFQSDVRAQSFVNPTGRVGVYVGERIPRVFVGWRPDYVRVSGGDRFAPGPLWYAGANRGEVEVEATPWLLIFAGAGRREYRPIARNRNELDGGVGGQWSLSNRWALLWALSARSHWSDSDVYDLVGATAITSLQHVFDGGWRARLGATIAGDYFPASDGYFGPDATTIRTDRFWKLSSMFQSPSWMGLRTGVAYDYSLRDSTSPAYDFTDHRFAMVISWSGEQNLSGPSSTKQSPVADLEWGVHGGTAPVQERVQELLRQDEQTLQRSCGCAE